MADKALVDWLAERVRAYWAQPGSHAHLTLNDVIADTLDRYEADQVASNSLGGFRKTDPATSRKAAIHNYPRSGSQRHAVLLAIYNAGPGGITADEAVLDSLVEYRSLTPRVGELKRGGWIRALEDVTRKTSAGADAEVLVVTDKGKAAVESELGGPQPQWRGGIHPDVAAALF